VQADTLIGSDSQPAQPQITNIPDCRYRFASQGAHPRGMLIERFPGLCQTVLVSFRAVKQRRFELTFQFADGNADRRLRAEHTFCRTADAAFFDNGHEHLKLHQLSGYTPATALSPV
jgi:hypothetical protein